MQPSDQNFDVDLVLRKELVSNMSCEVNGKTAAISNKYPKPAFSGSNCFSTWTLWGLENGLIDLDKIAG